MKILQVNVTYKEGSTGKIVSDLHKQYILRGYKSIVCYGRGRRYKEPFVYKTGSNFVAKINKMIGLFTGYQYAGAFMATSRLINIIRKERPDIVHLHVLNGNMCNIYRLVRYLKSQKINTVLTNHAEFMYTGSYSHVPDNSTQWMTGRKEKISNSKKLIGSLLRDTSYSSFRKMERTFTGFNTLIVTSVSPWLTERSKQSIILNRFKHFTVLNGIDKDIFKPRVSDIFAEYRKKYKYIVLYVTSGFHYKLKGGNYLLDIARSLLDKGILFLIVGSKAHISNLPENCINIGKLENQNLLAEFYSNSDISLITSKKETFSMVVAESLCCGTPVVGFKAGGPESIAKLEFASFVDYPNTKRLADELLHFVRAGIRVRLEKNDYSVQKMADDYLQIYENGFTPILNGNR